MPDLDTTRPFARSQAITAGISPMTLRGPRFRQLFRNVYVNAGVPFHPGIRTAGALLTHPDGAFAPHQSAARLYGLPVPDTSDEHVSVFAKSDRRKREGIISHVTVRQPVGTLLFRLDLSYVALRLAIEYDGQQHRADVQQWDHDITRGDWLERDGWRVLPVISKGIYRRPDQTSNGSSWP